MLLAAFCFYMSSFDYARIMGEVKQERTEAIVKAIEIAPEIAQMNARQTINIDPQILNDALKKIEVLDGNTTRGRSTVYNLNDSDSQFSDVKSQKRMKSTGSI